MGVLKDFVCKMLHIDVDDPLDGKLTDSGHYQPNMLQKTKSKSSKSKSKFEYVDDSLHTGMRKQKTRRKLGSSSKAIAVVEEEPS